MLRRIVVTIGVSAMVLGVAGSAGAAPPPGHQEILNEVKTGNSQHSGITQNWDKVLPADDPGGACPNNSSRFTCVMGGAAVRDNETGLVWEQSPETTAADWNSARYICANKTIGGRKGWRLPSFAELSSLVDPANSNPALPTGHPFTVQSAPYWSTSTNASDPSVAWFVYFNDGVVFISDKNNGFVFRCVRGAMNADQY